MLESPRAKQRLDEDIAGRGGPQGAEADPDRFHRISRSHAVMPHVTAKPFHRPAESAAIPSGGHGRAATNQGAPPTDATQRGNGG